MTPDERLDRLSERVDAIAQSLELLTTLHRDLEQQTAARFAETAAETAARFSETLGFINRLARIADIHEQRLDDLESRQ